MVPSTPRVVFTAQVVKIPCNVFTALGRGESHLAADRLSVAAMLFQVGVSSAKLQITAKDLAASQLLAVQQAGQLQQQGQALGDLSSRCKQLEQQLTEAQQQVSTCSCSQPYMRFRMLGAH
jgi:uncharacterized protein HemX